MHAAYISQPHHSHTDNCLMFSYVLSVGAMDVCVVERSPDMRSFPYVIAKIKKTYLQNWVISTQNEYTNYLSHFKYKMCLKIISLILFRR